MAILRTHPWLFGNVGFGLLTGVLAIVFLARQPAHRALADDGPGGYGLISPVEAGAIAQLRKDAALDDDVLAALNLRSPDAVTVVAAIRTWYENNTTRFQIARAAVADQQALIRAYQSANNNGQEVGAALHAAKAALPDLQSAYSSLLSDCRTAALTTLSNDQNNLATLLQTRANIPMPYRLVALSSQQDQTLQRLRSEFQLRYGATADPEAQSAALSKFGQDVASTLGPQTVTTLQSLTANIPTSSANVVNALQTVLAVDPNQ